MSHIELYKKYFTKEYLMGPNSFRLLDELMPLHIKEAAKRLRCCRQARSSFRPAAAARIS